MNEIKFATFNSESMLREANHTFEKLQQKVSELKLMTKELEDKAALIASSYQMNAQPKTNQVIELQKGLHERSDQILRQADAVANRTQKLLDHANNGLEGLNRINKSLSGKLI